METLNRIQEIFMMIFFISLMRGTFNFRMRTITNTKINQAKEKYPHSAKKGFLIFCF